MLLGALVDAGADLGVVQTAIDAVIPGAVRVTRTVVTRAGLRATKVDVDVLVADPPHRTWRTIRDLLPAADIAAAGAGAGAGGFRPARGRGGPRSRDRRARTCIFMRSARWIRSPTWSGSAPRCTTSALCGSRRGRSRSAPVGSGSPTVTSRCRSRRSPNSPAGGGCGRAVPASSPPRPGWPWSPNWQRNALNYRHCRSCEVGVGAGTRDTPGTPNVVRVILGQPGPQDAAGEGTERRGDAMVVMDTNVDDLDPRLWPGVLTALLTAGAADAWLTPIVMKKGRPAHTLSVLGRPEQATGTTRGDVPADQHHRDPADTPCSGSRCPGCLPGRRGRRSVGGDQDRLPRRGDHSGHPGVRAT